VVHNVEALVAIVRSTQQRSCNAQSGRFAVEHTLAWSLVLVGLHCSRGGLVNNSQSLKLDINGEKKRKKRH
jgi:hypothetical protein